MEGCCSFKAIVDGVCVYTLKIEIVMLLSCYKDIDSLKSTYRFTGHGDEVGLIL